jgi:hypothetical protein
MRVAMRVVAVFLVYVLAVYIVTVLVAIGGGDSLGTDQEPVVEFQTAGDVSWYPAHGPRQATTLNFALTPPAAILQAVSERMAYVQTTDMGSDANAKALVDVLRAIATLDGKVSESPEGTPIIQ